MMKNLLLLSMLLLSLFLPAQESRYLIQAPAGDRFTAINREGVTVIPNGRLLTPLGRCITVAPHPYGLVLSHDGNTAITANSGIQPLAITIIRDLASETPEVQQVPEGTLTDKGVLASVFMGLSVSPDNRKVYVSGGQENKIFIFNIGDGMPLGTIDCSWKDAERDYSHGFLGDMVMRSDGKRLYVVDQIGFRMLVIDLDQQKLISSVPVGRYPFGITLSPDEKTVYVANVGMYEYGLIRQKQGGEWKQARLDFPPYSYGSEEAERGIMNDTLMIPGLGPMDSEQAFSVWAISLIDEGKPVVTAKVRTGTLVGDLVEGIPAVGGSSPNSLVANENYVFISNGNNDNITVLDLKSGKIVSHIPLSPDPRLNRLRGIIPFGLALSPGGKRLFVAESGLNAVAVINTETLQVLGHLPTGWFPSKLKVSPDGKRLVISNAKGFGSGPNGGVPGPEGTYIGSIMKGTVQLMDLPDESRYPALTQQVLDNNFRFTELREQNAVANPIPRYPGEFPSPIRHIVFISKENRTYDEVFGQLKNGRGDSTLARYGWNASFSNRDKSRSVKNADVMPNHLALAGQFACSDNFYVDSDVSADGHRWLVNTYPNEWVEATTPANYGGNRDYRENSKAPGNLGINGASGAIYPEDYNEGGSMWDHLARNKVDYFNFGFSVMFEPADYQDHYKYGGIKHLANFPLPATLHERTSRLYPTYNMAIPDQFRVDMFKKEFMERWGEGKDPLPRLLTVIIPNDHGAGERPEAGYPFRESYMADNDLAVGRIVEFLSHTPFWKEMVIIITEDDAQNGVDHVDAHRSILMVISPYVKRDYVSHTHYSFGSIFKTFWNLLGLPYLNQYDAGANDLSDFFTPVPDYTPYRAILADPRVFDPVKALDPLDETFDWKQLQQGPDLDNPDDMLRESKEQEEWRKQEKK